MLLAMDRSYTVVPAASKDGLQLLIETDLSKICGISLFISFYSLEISQYRESLLPAPHL